MKIALILVYFGKWPEWFPAFLLSCKYNRKVDWLVFTDCEVPEATIDNVNFIPFSMAEFRQLATGKLGFPVTHDNPYKLCDFKPTYGRVFEDYLDGYDFWGHCDLDVIWGDIRKYVTDEILENHDVISARKAMMCGHFSLFRHTPRLSKLYTLHSQHLEALEFGITVSFDEVGMTMVVAEAVKHGWVKVWWPRFVLDEEFTAVLRRHKAGWRWERGSLYNDNLGGKEIMYLHFEEWKSSLRSIDFSCQDNPDVFFLESEKIYIPGS